MSKVGGGGDMRGSQRDEGARSQMVWTIVATALTLRERRALQKVLSKEVT